MAGYTRQSAASIINGENITAPPINAEFNTLQDAFSGSTGHAHDGTTGNGPKIDLATSVSGFLPAASGGLGGKNNYAATSDPTVGDDINDGYAVGSVWYNVPDDRYYVCVYNVAGAAVWLENRFINSSGDFAPHANNTKDLGHTLKRWKDLFLSGNADIDGSLNVATTTYLGGILTVNANAIFNVGTTTTISNIDVASGAIDNAAIGTTVAAAGTFTTLSATTSLTAATADINGGSIDGATVGANSHSTGKFTTLESTGLATLNSVNIDGGAIDGAVIGANSAVAGSFTTISSAGQATLASVDINGGAIDGATIGATSASTITGTTITGTSLVGPVTGNLTGNSSGTHTGPVTGAVTGNLTGNVSSSGTSTFNNVTIDGTLNMNAGTSATITNLSAPTNDNDAARKVDVDNAVANLVDSAPGTLDTLNELAAALGDDPDFATTITNSIATKLPLAGGTMTGAIAMSTNKITGVGDPTAAQDVSNKAYTDQQDALQVTKSGDSMSGNLAMGSNNITGLATPTANDHASNKSYVDGLFQSTQAAATSASNAATSESNAATSETNASNSASAAATSEANAAASYDDFDDRYLGAKASAPSVDNDGDALVVGALYFNSTTNIMNVYGSGGWQSAGSAVNGTSDRQTYTVATAGQTVFAATYDAGYVDVYLNGVKQLMGTDVTATNGTSVVFASGTTVNDIVDIVAYGTFVLADHLTQTQSDARYVEVAGDTMTGDLNVTGTVTADGLTVNASASGNFGAVISSATQYSSDALRLQRSGVAAQGMNITAGGESVIFDSQNTGSGGLHSIFDFKSTDETTTKNVLKINGKTNDISFYEDTGTTPKFFWDASQESLAVGAGSLNLSGVGTDSQNSVITLQGTNQFRGILELASQTGVSSSGSPAGEIRIFDAGNLVGKIAGLGTDLTNHDDGDLQFSTSSNGTLSEVLRLTSDRTAKISTSQNMGSLATFPSYSGEGAYLKGFVNGGGSGPYPRYLDLAAIGDSSWGGIMRFITNPDSSATGQERMRIAEDGNIGINYTDPSRKLYVASNDSSTGGNVVAVRNNNSTGGAFINFIAGGANAPSVGAKGNDIVFTDDGYSGNEHLRLTNSGNLLLRSTDTSGITGGVSPYLEFRAGQTNGQNVSLAKMRGYSPGAWGGDLIFETKPANGQVNDTTVETMRIDQAGRVTMPNQPAFHAGLSTNTSSLTSGSVVVFNSVYENVGNHYNTSTGLFTAPVTGFYSFTTRLLHQGVSNGFAIDSQMSKNNSSSPGYGFLMQRHKYQADYTGHTGYLAEGTSGMIYLAAGDTFRVKYGGSQNTVIHGNPAWTYFCGHLVG